MPRGKRNPVPADPKPEPVQPSPAVIRLQNDIVELVSRRDEASNKLQIAHGEYLAAQAQFQICQGDVQRVEQGIQYRLNLIAQMENRTPAPQPSAVISFPGSGYTDMSGVTSEPTRPTQDDLVNRSRADALRAAL